MNTAHIPAFTLEPQKKAAAAHPAPTVRAPNFINDIAAGRVELPQGVRSRFTGADGKPDASFVNLYEALQGLEPTI